MFNGGVCPGDSDPTTLSSCISRLSSCLTCITSREADNLDAVDCDLIDDGDDSNNSCAGV